jgi:hypothetical protein
MLFGIKTTVESLGVFIPRNPVRTHSSVARKGGGLKGLTGREKIPLDGGFEHCRTAERGLKLQGPVLTIRPAQGERATRKRHPPAFGTGCPHASFRGGANGKQVRRTAGSQLQVGSRQLAVQPSANCKLTADG